jgi:hypothetical protein
MQVATIISTDTGSALNFQTLDDTGVTGELPAENGTSAQTAFTVATTTLGAYKYSSKQILTSFELFQDGLIDIENIVEVFDETQSGLLKFPGQFGEMLGPLERDWFIAIAGSMKKGKSWVLQEFAVQAVMSRLKVVFISLEMKAKDIHDRFYKRITAFSYYDEDVTYPVFDCVKNQRGDCNYSKRINKITLLDDDGSIPEFDPDSKYRPCTICRKDKKLKKQYDLATWWETFQRPSYNLGMVAKNLKAFTRMYSKNNLRIKTYPKFTANVTDLKRDLDILEHTDDFIPDVIIIDYADILKPEYRLGEKRYMLDETWKTLGGLASERHCLVVTGTQTTRGSIYKESLTQDDLAEWIGKLAHVDIMLALNQTKDEKSNYRLRLGLLAHRHKSFQEDEMCLALQNLDVGQVLLDGEITRQWG